MVAIICFPQTNFLPEGQGKTYTKKKKDLTKYFPNGIHSAKVLNNAVTVFQEINYHPKPGKDFPYGFKSLQV